MAKIILPDQSYLRECLDYDPETGLLLWKPRPRHHFKTDHEFSRWNTRYRGTPAGSLHSDGYIKFHLNGKMVSAQRVIYKLMTSEEPFIVDHENRNTSANHFTNLRPATKSQNMANSCVQKNNALGLKGVELLDSGRFRSKIAKDGKRVQIGIYDSAEEAHAAYCEAARLLHGEFWNPG